MTEIEIKAHVANPDTTEQRIRSFAKDRGESIKRDVYWKNDLSAVKIRIREEKGLTVVTYKQKELRGSMEVNSETEFAVSERSAFEILLADLGFHAMERKEKHTKSFEYASPDGFQITLELSLISGLGWFLELEILSETDNENTIETAGKSLRSALARCGIPESEIESRYYTEMLALMKGENQSH